MPRRARPSPETNHPAPKSAAEAGPRPRRALSLCLFTHVAELLPDDTPWDTLLASHPICVPDPHLRPAPRPRGPPPGHVHTPHGDTPHLWPPPRPRNPPTCPHPRGPPLPPSTAPQGTPHMHNPMGTPTSTLHRAQGTPPQRAPSHGDPHLCPRRPVTSASTPHDFPGELPPPTAAPGFPAAPPPRSTRTLNSAPAPRLPRPRVL